ncbi:hypothetical protein QQZ08_008697 [Neonectria magnoliae]|uniref:Uncharacterized protein n=1 Tax=Neonectria magnoliae TaxID=2732573 RepID=A0ABR1HSR0_9HYPO
MPVEWLLTVVFSTSAAYSHNGSIVHLAKVPASEECRQAMMRIVQTPPKSRLARFLEQVPDTSLRLRWGFQHCAPFESYGHGGQDEDEQKNKPVSFVSWAEGLVYTEVRSAQCFYNKPKPDKIRGKMTIFPDEHLFKGSPWSLVLEDVISRAFCDLKWYHEQTLDSAKEAIVLLEGETSEVPFTITKKVVRKLRYLFGRTSPEDSQRGVYNDFQLVWQDNATFAVASGAAL